MNHATALTGYDLAVSTIIVHDGCVLFALHKAMKRWVPVGGHVQTGELPEEAALREAREECGLELQLIGERELNDTGDYRCLLRPAFMDLHRVEDDHWHLGVIYFAVVTGGELRLEHRELEDLRWFSESELDDPRWRLTPALIHYARTALSHVGRR